MSGDVIDLRQRAQELLQKKLIGGDDVPLHPDLVDHVAENGGMKVVHHPLVIQPFYTPVLHNNWVNQMYMQKLEAVERARNEENWGRFVWLHERPYRVDALWDGPFSCGPVVHFPGLVLDVWSDTEFPHQSHGAWLDIWGAFRETGGLVPRCEPDASVFRELQGRTETITVYRGVGTNGDENGFSWALDKEVAMWFARRFSSNWKRGRVYTATIHPDDVLTYCNARSEQEVVVYPGVATVTAVE